VYRNCVRAASLQHFNTQCAIVAHVAITGDRVAVTVMIDVEPADAFAAFTEDIDLWWRRGVAYRVAGRKPGSLAFEPRIGGRLFEEYQGPDGPLVHESGVVTAWEPPHRLAFDWRASNFAPGEVTRVEVTFTRTESGRTRVELVHTGFAALRPDHPVRHGEANSAFIRRLGLWWGELLSSLREHVAIGNTAA
jgi:uncharacterized protein YndB with AHSA1/START domain